MKTALSLQEKAYQKYAWIVLFALGILLVVNIFVVAGVEDHVSEFGKDTGVAWDAFSAAYPSVAAAYTLNQRLLYVGFASLVLFGLVITWFGFRTGHRWAWFAMWLLPIALAATALLMTQARQRELPVLYGGFAIVAVIGLLLPVRKFFRKRSDVGSTDDHEAEDSRRGRGVIA